MSKDSSQKGFTHLLLIFFLIIGLAVGLGALGRTTNLIPRANEANPNSILPINEYDKPLDLSTYNQLESGQIVLDTAKAAGLSTITDEDDNFVYLDFDPQESSDQQANEKINAIEPYYLRTMMWLLLQTNPSVPIDPWYALCDHLSQENMDKVGAEPTTLIGEDYRQLQCSDPPPTYEQLGAGNSHARFVYKKIPEEVLLNMLMAWKLDMTAREDKNLSENAKDFSISLIPIYGTIINEIRYSNPGESPDETIIRMTKDMTVGLIMDAVGGKAIAKVGGVAYKTLRLAGKPVTFFGTPIKNAVVKKILTTRRISDLIDKESATVDEIVEALTKANDITDPTITEALKSVLSKDYSPEVIRALENRFGALIGKGKLGITFSDGQTLTKIFKEVTPADLQQVAFYEKYGGIEGLPKFLGRIEDDTGRVVGFKQEFIQNAETLYTWTWNNGAYNNKLTQEEVDEAVEMLRNIQQTTGHAHGDLAISSRFSAAGKPGNEAEIFHGENILIQTNPDGTRKVWIIDWEGWNLEIVTNTEFISDELSTFKKNMQYYVPWKSNY